MSGWDYKNYAFMDEIKRELWGTIGKREKGVK